MTTMNSETNGKKSSPGFLILILGAFLIVAALGWWTNRADRLDSYRLGRTPVLRNDGLAFFRAKVDGMLDAEALAYRALRRGPWRRS